MKCLVSGYALHIVLQLQSGFYVDKENSSPRQNAIGKRHPEDYHRLLKEVRM